jgi:hypothetical protein
VCTTAHLCCLSWARWIHSMSSRFTQRETDGWVTGDLQQAEQQPAFDSVRNRPRSDRFSGRSGSRDIFKRNYATGSWNWSTHLHQMWDNDIRRILPPPFTILRVFMALLLNKDRLYLVKRTHCLTPLQPFHKDMALFWDVAPCSLVDTDRCFWGDYCDLILVAFRSWNVTVSLEFCLLQLLRLGPLTSYDSKLTEFTTSLAGFEVAVSSSPRQYAA